MASPSPNPAGGPSEADEDELRQRMFRATKRGSVSMVRELVLTSKPDVNATNHMGQNALHVAVGLGKWRLVRYLVEHTRIDINAVDRLRRTPLLMALEDMELFEALYLIDHGADAVQDELETWLERMKHRPKTYEKIIQTIQYGYTRVCIRRAVSSTLEDHIHADVLGLIMQYVMDNDFL